MRRPRCATTAGPAVTPVTPDRVHLPRLPERPLALLALALPFALALALALALSGCATRTPDRDGPPPNPPRGLDRLPDAVPRVEPIRTGGPNKPYEAFGQRYVPVTEDVPLRDRGGASWYGVKFHGRPTSSGEPFDMLAMTAAHRTMPIPSYARVRNPANGREIVVRVNDRGPFVASRVIDLSYAAAAKLDLLRGVGMVEVLRLTHAEIRSGFWLDAAAPAASDSAAAASAAPAGPPLQLAAHP